jgi:hypothetical protein
LVRQCPAPAHTTPADCYSHHTPQQCSPHHKHTASCSSPGRASESFSRARHTSEPNPFHPGNRSAISCLHMRKTSVKCGFRCKTPIFGEKWNVWQPLLKGLYASEKGPRHELVNKFDKILQLCAFILKRGGFTAESNV